MCEGCAVEIHLSVSEGFQLLFERLLALPEGRRTLVAIAGAPGSGKSTLADEIVVRLNEREGRRAAVLPMDGYHFDDNLLRALGLLDRKGAPNTFDVAGLDHMLRRLKANDEEAVAVPVFDRNLEVARGAARLIPRTTDIIVVEGNYLLSTEQPWARLAPLFDLTVLLEVPEPVLRQRLVSRWREHGHTGPEALARAEANDLPNGRYVREKSLSPDIVLRTAA